MGRTAWVGAADHAGWAVFVTVGPDGALLDRRRVDLLDPGLPKLPHHHDAQALPLKEAVALVGRVRASAEHHARLRLDDLARSVPGRVVALAIRACPPLPETVEERIADYRSQNVADTVLYRNALAQAAVARGWSVRWYEPKSVLAAAAAALGRKSIEDLLEKTGAALGPPWQKDHRMAMAAAVAASGAGREAPTTGASPR